MLVIPRNTRFDETAIIHDGDVIIGANCTIDYGIFGRKVIIGDKTEVNGDVPDYDFPTEYSVGKS